MSAYIAPTIGCPYGTIGPYKTPAIQVVFNSVRTGFVLMRTALHEYVAGLRSHRIALLKSGDAKYSAAKH